MLVYHDVSSREHKSKVYADEILKVGVAEFSKYALQIEVQEAGLSGSSSSFGNKKPICVEPAPFCACAFINDFSNAKEDKKYSLYEKGLLANYSLPTVDFQQN